MPDPTLLDPTLAERQAAAEAAAPDDTNVVTSFPEERKAAALQDWESWLDFLVFKINFANELHVGIRPSGKTGKTESDSSLTAAQDADIDVSGLAPDEELDKAGVTSNSGRNAGNSSRLKDAKVYDKEQVRILISQTIDQAMRMYESRTNYSADDLQAEFETIRGLLFDTVRIVDVEGNDLNPVDYTLEEIQEKAFNLTESRDLEENSSVITQNVIHESLNMKGNELTADPTALLTEQKLKPVIGEAGRQGIIDPILARFILGYDNSDKEGLLELIDNIKETREEFDSAPKQQSALSSLQLNELQLFNLVDKTKENIEQKSNDFFRNQKSINQDFKGKLLQEVIKDPDSFFVGGEVIDPDTRDMKKLATNSAYLDDFVYDTIKELGGVGSPSSDEVNGRKLNSYEVKSYNEVNRIIRDQVQKAKDIYINEQGEIFAEVKSLAYRLGMSPENYVTNQLKNIVTEAFIPDESGAALYANLVRDNLELNRRKEYAEDPKAAGKALEKLLASDRSLWVNGKPVTASDVRIEDWNKWTQFFSEVPEDEAIAVIEGLLTNAVTDQRFSTEGSRTEDIITMAEAKGILGPNTSANFINHFTTKVAPRLALEASYQNIEGTQAIYEYYSNQIDGLAQADRDWWYYDRITNPGDPNDIFTGPQVPGLSPTEARVTAPPPSFDIKGISPELLELSEERPEFAEFVQTQLGSSEFMDAWNKASVEQVDEAGIRARLGAPEDEDVVVRRQQALLDVKREQIDKEWTDIVNRGADTDEAVAALEQRTLDAEKRFQMETGINPLTGERPAVGSEFMPGGFARKMIRDEFTTQGMTSGEFFKTQLPGFETRYKESPFFRLEEERKEREDEQRRRPLLRTGGPGRTVVTRGRR
tara:strand:+ start:413 stop:3043 length:2631 start_codon:yes stop_codon:yes gene_type:complete